MDWILQLAFDLGVRAGKGAAGWVEMESWGGRVSRKADADAAARNFLRMLEDGDPSLNLAPPDLSGQWADGLTPSALLEDLAWEMDLEATDLEEMSDEICQSWEDGAAEGFFAELERTARLQLEADGKGESK